MKASTRIRKATQHNRIMQAKVDRINELNSQRRRLFLDGESAQRIKDFDEAALRVRFEFERGIERMQ